MKLFDATLYIIVLYTYIKTQRDNKESVEVRLVLLSPFFGKKCYIAVTLERVRFRSFPSNNCGFSEAWKIASSQPELTSTVSPLFLFDSLYMDDSVQCHRKWEFGTIGSVWSGETLLCIQSWYKYPFWIVHIY